MDYPNEEFQYIEFASRNLPLIKEFYMTVFGWEFTDYGNDYTAFSGTYVQGGFYPGEPRPGSILPILYSSDINMSLEKVQKVGAEITREIFDFPGGRRFHFIDPDGNEIAVWSDV